MQSINFNNIVCLLHPARHCLRLKQCRAPGRLRRHSIATFSSCPHKRRQAARVYAASLSATETAAAPSNSSATLGILSDPSIEGEPLRFLKLSEAYWTVRTAFYLRAVLCCGAH